MASFGLPEVIKEILTMAQLDRLLTQIITKAGRRLELKADRKPRL